MLGLLSGITKYPRDQVLQEGEDRICFAQHGLSSMAQCLAHSRPTLNIVHQLTDDSYKQKLICGWRLRLAITGISWITT